MKGSRYTPKMAPIDISFMTLEEFRDSAIQNLEHILLSEKDSLS